MRRLNNALQDSGIPFVYGGEDVNVHEDKKMRPHSRNAAATALVQLDGWVATDDYIAGTAVIVEEAALQ